MGPSMTETVDGSHQISMRAVTPLSLERKVHVPGYQNRDYEVVDYHMAELPGTGLMFRGPLPDLTPASYFACIGAAQTLGCFCQVPYPRLIEQTFELPSLNLGYGGAGPEFFSKQPAVLEYVNRARFAVLQVMSARSQSNSYYECGGLEYVTLRETGQRLGAHAAFEQLVWGPQLVSKLPLSRKWKRRISKVIARSDDRVPGLVEELQAEWVKSSLALIEQISVPVLLLWFSQRSPTYEQRFGTAETTLGEYPHLVTQEMLQALRPKVAGFVECVSRRGSPQPLISRFTGKPTTVTPASDRPDLGGAVWHHNQYYPSPAMHEDAGMLLRDHLQSHRAVFGL
jgi:Domain of unknown function (DUF6473)